MAKPPKQSRTEDRSALERRVEALERENEELRARLARGPSDETWFTPAVLSLLFLGLFAAGWARYVPSARRAQTTVASAPTPGEYNPPAR